MNSFFAKTGSLSLLLGMLFVSPFAVKAQPKPGTRKPNIIYILADDLGYANLTCYQPGSKIPTPNLDKMAKEGTRFTQFYAGSTVCAPSRCALMTGLNMGHAYIRGNGEIPLRPQDTTMAQRLQQQGYATGMFGKWGLGLEDNTGTPQRKGFDAFFGYLHHRHAHRYFTDHLWQVKQGQLSKVFLDTTQYTHDLIIERALGFIESHRNEPFFLYLPITIPHAELLLPDQYVQPFRNPDGSSKFPPETPFVRQGGTYRTQKQPHAAFVGMITKMDGDVGRLLSLLKKLGLDENTYVFFTSDNGPHQEAGADPVYFRSSGPLRGIKRDLYEGGIRVPMIAWGPGRVPAGKVSSQIWANWDILPTVCQLTDTPVPARLDGISFAPVLQGKPQPKQHAYLYWQFNEGTLKEALRQGDWKLIRLKEKNKSEVLELYNLSNDLSEKKNLAPSNSAKIKELYQLMQQAKSPAENPAFDWTAMEQ